MKNNPVIPYILILAFGIGLIFFLSVEGVGNKEEIANAGEEATSTEGGDTASEAADGESFTQTCIGCHAADFKGQIGPDLTGLDAAKIEDVLVNGSGVEGGSMKPGFKTADEAKVIAEYITSNF